MGLGDASGEGAVVAVVGVVRRGSADGGKGTTVVGVVQQGWRCLRWCRRYNTDGGAVVIMVVVMVVWWKRKVYDEREI